MANISSTCCSTLFRHFAARGRLGDERRESKEERAARLEGTRQQSGAAAAAAAGATPADPRSSNSNSSNTSSISRYVPRIRERPRAHGSGQNRRLGDRRREIRALREARTYGYDE
eukprot:2103477-Pyramimonas_sp.AAC.1